MIKQDIDLLDFDLVQMKKNVVSECLFEDILFDCSINNIKKILNDAIEIEVEENPDQSHRERGFIKKKNDAGIYISIKNIHISVGIILDALSVGKEMNPLAIVIFLYNLFKQLRVDIDKWQMAIYMILYEENRHINITDENLLSLIQNKITEYGYEKAESDKIMNTIGELYNKKLICIENGEYKANEKVYC